MTPPCYAGSYGVGRFLYTGQAWLPELGLYYYKARMYSPTLGRFMQTDPIGYADGTNWYNYVGGDPVNASDPSGLTGDAHDVWPCTGSLIKSCAQDGSGGFGGSSISHDLFAAAGGGGGGGGGGFVSSTTFELR